MKRRSLLLLVLALLCLCGCSWMDGSYNSVTPHVVTPDQDSEETDPISTYAQLRNALTDLVDAGAVHGLLTLTDYPEDRISTDMRLAIDYVQDYYPIGAYAVENIEFEYGTGNGQNAISVDISYFHGKSEIDRIQTVRGISGAKNAISSALFQCSDSIVLQVTNYETADFAQITADFAAEYPQLVIESPQVTCQVYPESGDIRVVELLFTYQTSRESLRAMQSSVARIFSSAQFYPTGDAADSVKFSQLYTFLTERFDYTFETSITPAYSLLCHGVGDSKAFAQVYAAMCRQSGLECLVVSGTKDGESHFWNIIRDGENYCHVDVLHSLQESGYLQRSDGEMQGYVWDYSAYPACDPVEPPPSDDPTEPVGISEPAVSSEPADPSEPTEPTGTSEATEPPEPTEPTETSAPTQPDETTVPSEPAN